MIEEYPHILESKNIVAFQTIGSWYNNSQLRVYDDKEREYRISCGEILKSLDVAYPIFKVKKARTLYHLFLVTEKDDVDKIT
jgi:hypothetical protein